MARKSDLFDCFKKYKTTIDNLCGLKIKEFQSDNALEFLKLTPYIESHGIVHKRAFPHTRQSIGRVEHGHQHLVDMGLSMIYEEKLPITFWDFAFGCCICL